MWIWAKNSTMLHYIDRYPDQQIIRETAPSRILE